MTIASPKEQARIDLPNFPEDIFVLWMDKFIDRSGWPPKKIEAGYPKDCWEKLLLRRDLGFWRQRKWEKRAIPLGSHMFPRADWERVSEIIGASVDGHDNVMKRMIHNTRERFERIRGYVETHARLPQPPLLLEVKEDRFEIMDGHHRLAVLFFLVVRTQLRKTLSQCCEAWVAR